MPEFPKLTGPVPLQLVQEGGTSKPYYRLPRGVNKGSLLILEQGKVLMPRPFPGLFLGDNFPDQYLVNGNAIELCYQPIADGYVSALWGESSKVGNAPPVQMPLETNFQLRRPGSAQGPILVFKNGFVLFRDEYTDTGTSIALKDEAQAGDTFSISWGIGESYGMVQPVRALPTGDPHRFLVPGMPSTAIALQDGRFLDRDEYRIDGEHLVFNEVPASPGQVGATWVNSLPELLPPDEDNDVQLDAEAIELIQKDDLSEIYDFHGLPGGSLEDNQPKDKLVDPKAPPSAANVGINIPASNDEDPCVAFPHVAIPPLNLSLPEMPRIAIPQLTLPSFDFCIPAYGPIRAGGRLDGFITKTPLATDNVTVDGGDPKTKAKEGGETIVSVPSDPQHISKEIAQVAPEVGADLVGEFGHAVVSLMGTIGAHVNGFIDGLTQKAAALGDAAAKAMADGLSAAMNGLEDAQDFGVWMANGGINAVNQAAAMIPYRQIPIGLRDPLSAVTPPLTLFSDAAHSANWVLNNTLVADFNKSVSQLNNGLSIATDLYNQSFGMCLGKQATWQLSQAADFNMQGLTIPSFGAQVDAMARMMVIHPFHLNGISRTHQSWRFDCHQLKSGAKEPVTSSSELMGRLNHLKESGGSGAMPGNLLHLAYGDDPYASLPSNFMLLLPLLIALKLGSPFLAELQLYLNNPSAKYDSMTGDLPSMILAGDPRIAKLLKALQALQKVIQFCQQMPAVVLMDLEKNVTEVGSSLVMFIKRVREDALKFKRVENLASDYISNRLSVNEQNLLTNLALMWDELAVDTSVIANENRKRIALEIIGPKKDVLAPGERLSTLMVYSTGYLNNFGGHMGAEVAPILALFMLFLRMLLLTDDPSVSETMLLSRSARMLEQSKEHTAEITNGGGYTQYVSMLASTAASGGGLQDMVGQGMVGAVTAVKDMTWNQHVGVAVSNEMMANHYGKKSSELQESANQINVTAENADTNAYVNGALSRHTEAIKGVVTKSLPSVGGLAKSAKETGVSEAPDARAQHVEGLIKEVSNALASTTISKATGARLNQQYEGSINQAKFILTQAGSSLTQEAPVLRNAGRLLVNQAQLVLTEGDALDFRGQWLYQLIDKSYGISTTDLHVFSKGLSVITSKKAHYFGQDETVMADNTKLSLTAGNASQLSLDKEGNAVLVAKTAGGNGSLKIAPDGTVTTTASNATGSAGAQVVMKPNGEVTVTGSTKVTLVVGGSAIVIVDGKIDLNPSAAPSSTRSAAEGVTNVDVKYMEAAPLQAVPDKKPAALHAKGARNPIPCAAPWKPTGA